MLRKTLTNFTFEEVIPVSFSIDPTTNTLDTRTSLIVTSDTEVGTALVPEPSTLTLSLISLGVLGLFAPRRIRRRSCERILAP